MTSAVAPLVREITQRAERDPRFAQVLELLVALANDPRFYLDMSFEPGDVQWLKNAAILHKRTAYEDFEEPERKRHLLRARHAQAPAGA